LELEDSVTAVDFAAIGLSTFIGHKDGVLSFCPILSTNQFTYYYTSA